MIPEQAIVEWRREAPWAANALVEQDLVISRALIEIFRVPELSERLAFRGGTALFKLHLRPPARYSEDIDLVQIRQEPIGDTLNLIRNVLDPWLGAPQWKPKKGRVNLTYRFESEESPSVPMRLKIEINSREHFTELGYVRLPFGLENQWFSGQADVTTFHLEEMLGTKLRALYQRKKGRDLFDLAYALEHADIDTQAIVRCFHRYMSEGGHQVSRAQFEANLNLKAKRPDFRNDMTPIIRPGVAWDFDTALVQVLKSLVATLPGDPWKGGNQ